MNKHADLLKMLLPPVAYEPNAPLLSADCEIQGVALDQSQIDADVLLAELDPRTTSLLLPDWERNYGLPDPCAGQAQTVAERRARLVQKVTERGGLSIPYFINVAERLGFPGVTITEFRPAKCTSKCTAAVYSAAWIGVWQVNVPQTETIRVLNVRGRCNEPLRSWGNQILECVIRRLKPSDTHVLFAYGV